MTISLLGELPQSSAEWAISQKRSERTYQRTFKVATTDPAEEAVSVLAAFETATGIMCGAYYPNDTGSFCQSIKPSRSSEDGLEWTVTVEYKPYPKGQQSDNPLAEPAQWNCSFSHSEQVREIDCNGNAICNSAGDPFQDPLIYDVARPHISITQNESSFPQTAASYVDYVNSDTFLGWGSKCVRCTSIGAQSAYKQEYGHYWVVSYEFDVKQTWPDGDGGWVVKVYDKGLKEKDPNGGSKPVPIKIPGGQIASTAIYLDGSGHPLDNPSPDNAHILSFDIYPETSFSGFTFR